MTPLHFANFDAELFLREYWQRKPLLIKGALPHFVDPLAPEELAGLACEEGVESRLVFTRGSSYRMKQSPFQESDFTSLPKKNWTLLVQAVDHYVPEVKALLQCVDFLPSWRVDDVMISYATQGGGVGPHFDYYDVFLVQGLGNRTWRLGQRCSVDDTLLTSSGLKLLREFHASAEYQLEPGDVLYVPPGLAHWGVAENNSLCYSLGFRAPAVSDMVIGFTDQLVESLPPDLRYTDPRPLTPAVGGELTADALAQARKLLREALDDDAALLRWFGELQTRPRYPELIGPPRRVPTLNADSQVMLHPGSRLAWHEDTDHKRLLCFIDGECQELRSSAQLRKLLSLLAQPALPFVAGPYLRNNATRALLEQLLAEGQLVVQR
jgi:50S ribosomal protein L16 3-hydroxylase